MSANSPAVVQSKVPNVSPYTIKSLCARSVAYLSLMIVMGCSSACAPWHGRVPLVSDVSGHTLVPLEFGDVELHFVLDTAALMSAADPAVLERLHSRHVSRPYLVPTRDPRDYVPAMEAPTGARSDNALDVPLLERSAVSLSRFRLGELFVHKHRSVILHDFEHFRASGLQIDGILGLDVLSSRPVELNFCADEMRFSESFSSSAELTEALELSRTSDGFRELSLSVDRHQVRFLLDTGASHSYLSAAKVQTVFGDRPPERILFRRRADAYGVQEPAPMRTFLAESVQIGEISVQEFEFYEGDYNILGMDFIGRFRWHIDFQRDLGRLATCH